jgi:subtilisin family serine protease
LAGTALWVGLTLWALLGPGRALRGQPPAPDGGEGSSAAPEPTTLLSRLRSGARLRGLSAPADEPVTLAESLSRVGADEWHAAGHSGRGLKVAILDTGFKGYRAALGKALPASVKVRSFRFDGNLEAKDSQHGILCAEVVHTLAPGAELLLANWEPDRPEQFLEAVRWARSEGARLLSCSIVMPTWSDGEGRGPTHEKLADALGPPGRPGAALLFASAGNTALRHWGGAYRPLEGGWHDWGRGAKENALRPLSNDRVSAELTAPGGVAYELVVRDATDGKDVGSATSSSASPISRAVVRFAPRTGHDYTVRVRRTRPSAAGAAPAFHLTILGGKLQTVTRRGSVPFPADGAEVVAVGATDSKGRRLPYSSCGPVAGRLKPDLAAPVPFFSAWRPGQPFAGTSAAAPQAAALAALVWSRNPGWTAERVREELCKAARPGAARGASETGRGIVHLPRAEGKR